MAIFHTLQYFNQLFKGSGIWTDFVYQVYVVLIYSVLHYNVEVRDNTDKTHE